MLVVGNSRYAADGWPSLPNATSDVEAVCKAFAAQGFRVIKLEDAGQAATTAAISNFVPLAEKADTALFYFAGHGFEYAGTNFLVPVDAPLAVSRAELAVNFVDLAGAVRAVMKSRHPIVFLDACRTRAPVVTVIGANPKGPDGPVGDINLPDTFEGVVFYSTARGRPAFDAAPAESQNSPFAEAVIARLGTPNLELNRYFAFVRADVKEKTLPEQGGPQIPTPYGVLEDDYFLRRSSNLREKSASEISCELSGDCDAFIQEMATRDPGEIDADRGFSLSLPIRNRDVPRAQPRASASSAKAALGSAKTSVPRTEAGRPISASTTQIQRITAAKPGRARAALASLSNDILRQEDEPQIIGRLLAKASATEIATLASAGDPTAEYLYGSMLYQGIGVPKDLAAARTILAKAATSGSPAAQLEYGFFLDNYGTSAADKAEALTLFEAAAAKDWPKAQSHLAFRLWSITGSEHDPARALTLWRKAAAGGHAYGWYALAAHGREFAEARRGLKKLIANGDPVGNAWLCEVENSAQTPRAAMSACLAAAQDGYPGPMAILAQLYGTGQFGPGSAKEARYWARLAASKNELDPQYRTALLPLIH